MSARTALLLLLVLVGVSVYARKHGKSKHRAKLHQRFPKPYAWMHYSSNYSAVEEQGCVDLRGSKCKAFASKPDYCFYARDFMRRNCRKSCGICADGNGKPKVHNNGGVTGLTQGTNNGGSNVHGSVLNGGCEDLLEDCSRFIKTQSQCTLFTGMTRKYCAKTCGYCCSDQLSECPLFIKKPSQCSQMNGFFRKYCAQSCKFCGLPRLPVKKEGCADELSECKSFKIEDCRVHEKFCQQYCAKSCGYCDTNPLTLFEKADREASPGTLGFVEEKTNDNEIETHVVNLVPTSPYETTTLLKEPEKTVTSGSSQEVLPTTASPEEQISLSTTRAATEVTTTQKETPSAEETTAKLDIKNYIPTKDAQTVSEKSQEVLPITASPEEQTSLPTARATTEVPTTQKETPSVEETTAKSDITNYTPTKGAQTLSEKSDTTVLPPGTKKPTNKKQKDTTSKQQKDVPDVPTSKTKRVKSHKPTRRKNCEDLIKECPNYVEENSQFCHYHVNFMKKYCSKSCKFCETAKLPKCVDRRKRKCKLYSKFVGYCTVYKKHMAEVCPKSCGFCDVSPGVVHEKMAFQKVDLNYEFAIKTKWDGTPINHNPIKIKLSAEDSNNVRLEVSGPFFDKPGKPPCLAGQPCWQLWDYEVAEVFFLGEKEKYLELEVSPHGPHLLLLLDGVRKPFKTKLPMRYSANIDYKTLTWNGTAIVPMDYFPPGMRKINAYAIHGPNSGKIYESLYPAKNTVHPDFHRLEFFQDFDFKSMFPTGWKQSLSPLWVGRI